MKKFINRVDDVIEEMMQGMAVLHPGTVRLTGHKVFIRADSDEVRDRQVAVISGGGSGHEPAHAGYIGGGMLSAAVLGEVFTSPSSDSVFAAIKAVEGAQGVLMVVKNYTGDRLNFGLAAEMARAEGIAVEVIVIDDDVALKDTEQATGARGLAGTILIHKLVGAAAFEGRNLEELASLGKEAVRRLATMGVSFSAGTSPAIGKPSFELREREMELGLGIHGEPGAERAELLPADRLTEALLRKIISHGNFGEERQVAVLVNNLGATTQMELAIVARRVLPFLERNGLTVKRIYAGTFLSSLDMAGISISVLGLKDHWIELLDAETTAAAWPRAAKQEPGRAGQEVRTDVGTRFEPRYEETSQTGASERTRQAIDAACRALIECESELTELDRITGDGDLGISMHRAATAVLNSLDVYQLDHLPATLKSMGQTLRVALGGSSGPLYGVFFLRCGSVLERAATVTLTQLTEALQQGCQAISELGGAKPGDRTMLDALVPFVAALKKEAEGTQQREVLMAAVAAAELGVEATKHMRPRLGRSSYLGDRVLGHADPGARAVAVWLRAAAETALERL